MRNLLFLIGTSLICPNVLAQGIANIHAFHEDGKVVIKYDLLSVSSSKEFLLKAYCSTDGGATFGSMLTQATGDINSLVKPGTNKIILWDYTKESYPANSEFEFRLDAMKIDPSSSLSTFENKGISFQILEVARSHNDISVSIIVSNKNVDQNPAINQFIFANFFIVDSSDKICREIIGENKLYMVPLNERRIANVIVKGISPGVNSFSQFDFSASGINVKFKNVPIQK